MHRDEIVCRLRNMRALQLQLALLEEALEQLTECEREIIDNMYINPVPKVADKICEMFDIEVAAVYRRRNKALKKLGDFLSSGRKER